MLPYLRQSIQFLNVYNYFKILTMRITTIGEPNSLQVDHVTPYLRNIMRLLMFFLIDISEAKLESNNELTKTVNKNILLLLEKMPADHLLEVMTMLFKYSITKNLPRKLSKMLMKCVQKTTSSQSFNVKAQKNVKLLFNFFVSIVQELQISDEDTIIRSVKSLFTTLFSEYKELCIEIVFEKLKQFDGTFVSREIQTMFNNFIGNNNKTD